MFLTNQWPGMGLVLSLTVNFINDGQLQLSKACCRIVPGELVAGIEKGNMTSAMTLGSPSQILWGGEIGDGSEIFLTVPLVNLKPLNSTTSLANLNF